jgi:hypothetical protein
MKRRRFNRSLIASALLGALAACGGGSDAPVPVLDVDVSGVSTINAVALSAQLTTYPIVAPLSAAEAASLAYMREEEQLAHDVYAVSAMLYATPVFANITASEATHSAAIKTLLDRYQQVDPLAGLPNGTFKTATFQTLYDTLVATSRVSLIEALKVGVQIEELDMRDITAQKADIDNADILMVYENLLRGSRNHLRAFMKVLTQQGGTYLPQYISQAEFDAIVNSAVETGR